MDPKEVPVITLDDDDEVQYLETVTKQEAMAARLKLQIGNPPPPKKMTTLELYYDLQFLNKPIPDFLVIQMLNEVDAIRRKEEAMMEESRRSSVAGLKVDISGPSSLVIPPVSFDPPSNVTFGVASDGPGEGSSGSEDQPGPSRLLNLSNQSAEGFGVSFTSAEGSSSSNVTPQGSKTRDQDAQFALDRMFPPMVADSQPSNSAWMSPRHVVADFPTMVADPTPSTSSPMANPPMVTNFPLMVADPTPSPSTAHMPHPPLVADFTPSTSAPIVPRQMVAAFPPMVSDPTPSTSASMAPRPMVTNSPPVVDDLSPSTSAQVPHQPMASAPPTMVSDPTPSFLGPMVSSRMSADSTSSTLVSMLSRSMVSNYPPMVTDRPPSTSARMPRPPMVAADSTPSSSAPMLPRNVAAAPTPMVSIPLTSTSAPMPRPPMVPRPHMVVADPTPSTSAPMAPRPVVADHTPSTSTPMPRPPMVTAPPPMESDPTPSSSGPMLPRPMVSNFPPVVADHTPSTSIPLPRPPIVTAPGHLTAASPPMVTDLPRMVADRPPPTSAPMPHSPMVVADPTPSTSASIPPQYMVTDLPLLVSDPQPSTPAQMPRPPMVADPTPSTSTFYPSGEKQRHHLDLSDTDSDDSYDPRKLRIVGYDDPEPSPQPRAKIQDDSDSSDGFMPPPAPQRVQRTVSAPENPRRRIASISSQLPEYMLQRNRTYSKVSAPPRKATPPTPTPSEVSKVPRMMLHQACRDPPKPPPMVPVPSRRELTPGDPSAPLKFITEGFEYEKILQNVKTYYEKNEYVKNAYAYLAQNNCLFDFSKPKGSALPQIVLNSPGSNRLKNWAREGSATRIPSSKVEEAEAQRRHQVLQRVQDTMVNIGAIRLMAQAEQHCSLTGPLYRYSTFAQRPRNQRQPKPKAVAKRTHTKSSECSFQETEEAHQAYMMKKLHRDNSFNDRGYY